MPEDLTQEDFEALENLDTTGGDTTQREAAIVWAGAFNDLGKAQECVNGYLLLLLMAADRLPDGGDAKKVRELTALVQARYQQIGEAMTAAAEPFNRIRQELLCD